MSHAQRFNIYVIALDKEVLNIKKFRDRNPNYIEGKPCVYVGMTGKSPEERFKQHKSGYKASKYPQKFGLYLRIKLFEKLNPMTFTEAKSMEGKLARALQKKGYAVWWN